jgi:26S proteasome regulatory subunit N2
MVQQPNNGVIMLHDTQPSEPKDLLEMKVKKAAPAPTPGQPQGSGSGASASQTLAEQLGSVLGRNVEEPAQSDRRENLVDEDLEDLEEVPGEFEYQTDGEE